MHRAMASRRIARSLAPAEPLASTFTVPLFLCPALARVPPPISLAGSRAAYRRPTPSQTTQQFLCQRRANHTEAISTSESSASAAAYNAGAATLGKPAADAEAAEAATPPPRQLPLSCSGCGAFAQTTDRNQLGFFDLESKHVRRWLNPKRSSAPATEVDAPENQVVESVLAGLDEATLKELGLDSEKLIVQEAPVKVQVQDPEPVCSRCHLLLHEIGNPEKVEMFHPTVDSLRETIEESPHKHNHIYHIIDAADFPMSLIPRLNVLLGDVPLRTRNRRSRSGKYMNDRKMEISFIITRGDLLGPTKEQVDRMMPKMREVLREALGRVGGRVRLGNVHCVSALRSWWTKELKQDIWTRGGAGWFVGKVNVGKSKLFQEVFPKGKVPHDPKADRTSVTAAATAATAAVPGAAVASVIEQNTADFGDLLPPARPLEMYPSMPIVSPHPGTTASPIRIPFGNHKGELIDLPGLARSDLENFVKREHRDDLIMQKRVVPEQITLQHGRSLILGGGLIRITPTTPGIDFLAYNFTRLSEHLTATEKAVEFQAQTRALPGVENISTEEAAEKMRSAGTFKLRYDVTKARSGPLTRKHRGGVPVEKLPFRVLSLDLLIEGVGYVEIVAQVRTKYLEALLDAQADENFDVRCDANTEKASAPAPTPEMQKSDDPFQALADNRIDESPTARKATQESERKQQQQQQQQQQEQEEARRLSRGIIEWPTVEVFTPEGKFVDYRQPIAGWLINKPRVLDKHKKKRPRRSMKGQKKKAKVMARAQAAEN